MRRKSPLPWTFDILEAIERIERYTHGKDIAGYSADSMLRDAVERNIERISEASKRLPAELKAQHPDVPWDKVAAIGNRFRHEYFRIDDNVIWEVVIRHLRPLREAVAAIRGRLKEGEPPVP